MADIFSNEDVTASLESLWTTITGKKIQHKPLDLDDDKLIDDGIAALNEKRQRSKKNANLESEALSTAETNLQAALYQLQDEEAHLGQDEVDAGKSTNGEALPRNKFIADVLSDNVGVDVLQNVDNPDVNIESVLEQKIKDEYVIAGFPEDQILPDKVKLLCRSCANIMKDRINVTKSKLKLFYYHIQTKLEEIFISSKAATGPYLSASNDKSTASIRNAITTVGDLVNLVPFVGHIMNVLIFKPASYQVGTSNAKKQAKYAQSISLLASLAKLQSVSHKTALRFTHYYYHQIKGLPMTNATQSLNDDESYSTPIYLAANAIVTLLIGVLNEQMISKKELAYTPLEDQLFRTTVEDAMLPTGPLKDYIAKISQPKYDIPFCRQPGKSEEMTYNVVDLLSKGGIVDEHGLIYAKEDTNAEKFGYYNGTHEIAAAKNMFLINLNQIRKYVSLDDLHWLIKEAAELPEDLVIKKNGDVNVEDKGNDRKASIDASATCSHIELICSPTSIANDDITKAMEQNLNKLHEEIDEIKKSIAVNNKQNLEIKKILSDLRNHLSH